MESMSSDFLLYGSNGFVGSFIARQAVQRGLRPLLSGRNGAALKAQASELDLQFRVFSLDDPAALESALKETPLVLNCAGPYKYTYEPMLEGCLRAGAHYLDITGEIPVYAALAARAADAIQHKIMLLPGVGFDVVPTDCLAAHLEQRLPTATHLTLAFQSRGSAGLPPGTANTMIEMLAEQSKIRRAGRLEPAPPAGKTRLIDFGHGPRRATQINWGDVFMAYYSTGIPNIEDYTVLPALLPNLMRIVNCFRPVFRPPFVRTGLKRLARFLPVPDAEQRLRTRVVVWGEVLDDQGRTAAARLHGPDAGVTWTAQAALAAVQKVLTGEAPIGFQTPALAYGPDFVLECDGVTREDLIPEAPIWPD